MAPRSVWSSRLAERRPLVVALGVLVAVVTLGCGDVNAALAKQSEARHLAADLLVQFTTAADAANRAVMADTDEASASFAREAEQAKQGVQKDVDALRPMLQGLNYADETGLLEQFTSRFAAYNALDEQILSLAVENTNLKAQRLSYGPAQDAADAFRDALEAVTGSAGPESWHIRALAATAVEMVREIQALQAPHIADPDAAAMTRMETRMSEAEKAARAALAALAPLVAPASRSRLAGATAALNRFMDANARLIVLSRRNTNVRTLALSLNEKRPLATSCSDSLRALRDALGTRGYPSGR